MHRQQLAVWLLAISLFTVSRCWAETIELVTYYPAISSTDRLHSNRTTTGTPYAPATVPDANVPDGTLLVSGTIGIDTTTPRTNPPNGSATGNLDVNDVWVRTANNGTGGWLSALLSSGGSGGPKFISPAKFSFEIPWPQTPSYSTSWNISSFVPSTAKAVILSAECQNLTNLSIYVNGGFATAIPLMRMLSTTSFSSNYSGFVVSDQIVCPISPARTLIFSGAGPATWFFYVYLVGYFE